jgi:hypothetical protein
VEVKAEAVPNKNKNSTKYLLKAHKTLMEGRSTIEVINCVIDK